MPQIATQTLAVETAKNFIDNVATRSANVYVSISHIQPWANDSSPDVPVDNISDRVAFWRGLVGGKKITGSDLSLVVPRVTWTNATSYAAYTDGGPPVYNTNFYVLTTAYNLYKCLSNNNNSVSIVEPTYTATGTTHQESDGYIWKYLLTVSTADRQKFLTSNWIPVKKLLIDDGSLQWQVQQGAIAGGIHVVNMKSGGANYSNVNNLVITITGDGTSAVATGNINTTSQTVSSITVTSPGSGYHFANVAVSGGGGTNATANVVISPFYGHGYDVTRELGAATVMINTRLTGNESGKLSTQNDYRQIGLLENPQTFGTSNTIANSAFSQTYAVQVSAGPGDYTLDEYVFQGGSTASAFFSGRVTDWNSTNNIVRLVDVQGTARSLPLVGANSGISRFTITVTNPDVVPYSGNILYLENIQPVQRANDQTESISTVLTF